MKNIHCCSCGTAFGKDWRACGVLRIRSIAPRGTPHFCCQNCSRKGWNAARHLVNHVQGLETCNKGVAS